MTIEEILGKYDGFLTELKESYTNIVNIIYKIKSGNCLENKIMELYKEYDKYLFLRNQIRMIDKIYRTLSNFSFEHENIYKLNRKNILKDRIGKLFISISKSCKNIHVNYGDYYGYLNIPIL